MIKKILSKLFKPLLIFLLNLTKNLPFITIFKFRTFTYKFILKKIGRNCTICENVTIRTPDKLIIGNRVSIHPNTLIQAAGDVTIGDNCGIANNCSILTVDHDNALINIPQKDQKINYKPVTIGNDVIIGSSAIIVGGTSIEEGSVIAPGSLVQGNIPAYSVVIGNPCRIVYNRRKISLKK